MTMCELCGHEDGEISSVVAEAIAAEADADREARTAEHADEREHGETLAEIHEDAETERTRIREDAETERTRIAAEAVVEIAETEAEAAVEIVETLTDEDEGQADEHEEEDAVAAEEEAEAGDGVTAVEVPPQADDGAHRSEPNGGTRRVRRAGPRFGRRR